MTDKSNEINGKILKFDFTKIRKKIKKNNFQNDNNNKLEDKILEFKKSEFEENEFIYIREIPYFIKEFFFEYYKNVKKKDSNLDILVINNTYDLSFLKFSEYGNVDLVFLNGNEENSNKVLEKYLKKIKNVKRVDPFDIVFKNYDLVSLINYEPEVGNLIETSKEILSSMLKNEGSILINDLDFYLLDELSQTELFEEKGFFFHKETDEEKGKEFIKIKYEKSNKRMRGVERITWSEYSYGEKNIMTSTPRIYFFKRTF